MIDSMKEGNAKKKELFTNLLNVLLQLYNG